MLRLPPVGVFQPSSHVVPDGGNQRTKGPNTQTILIFYQQKSNLTWGKIDQSTIIQAERKQQKWHLNLLEAVWEVGIPDAEYDIINALHGKKSLFHGNIPQGQQECWQDIRWTR